MNLTPANIMPCGFLLVALIGCGQPAPSPSQPSAPQPVSTSPDTQASCTDISYERISFPRPHQEDKFMSILTESEWEAGHLECIKQEWLSGSVSLIDKNLVSLDLSGTAVTAQALSKIAQLSSLEALWLNDTKANNAGMKSVSKLDRLKTLELSRTPVGNAGLKSLANLRDLRHLELQSTNIDDKGLASIAGKRIMVFGIGDTKVTAAGLLKNVEVTVLLFSAGQFTKTELTALQKEIRTVRETKPAQTGI